MTLGSAGTVAATLSLLGSSLKKRLPTPSLTKGFGTTRWIEQIQDQLAMYRHIHTERFQQLDLHLDIGFTENAWEVPGPGGEATPGYLLTASLGRLQRLATAR